MRAGNNQHHMLRQGLRGICAELSASSAGVLLDSGRQGRPLAVSVGIASEVVEDYREHYHLHCPLPQILAALRPGEFRALDAWQDAHFARRDDLRENFLHRHDIRYITVGRVPLPGGAQAQFGVQRGSAGEPFSLRDLSLLEEQVDTLARGPLSNLVAADPHVDAALSRLIDVLSSPTMLLTTHGDLLRANRPAMDLLRGQRLLALHCGRIALRDEASERELRQALQTPPGDGTRSYLRIEARGQAWIAALSWLDASLLGEPADKERYVLLQLGAPLNSTAALQPRILGTLFKLTPAEETLAWGLFIGHTVESFALAHDKQLSTVKVQLNSAMHKLGVTRQVDLVRWLAAIPTLA